MSHNILKAGTGTNYYYAKAHGEPIRNAVDCLGVTFCDDYRPTGASNSIDALEILCKGEPERERPPAPPPPAPAPEKKYDRVSLDPNSTFGFSRTSKADEPPANGSPKVLSTLDNPLQAMTPEEMLTGLQPGNGWSAEDSSRQLQALRYCQGSDGQATVGKAFAVSNDLGNSGFSKSGWGAALITAAVVSVPAAVVLGPLVFGAGLALGAAGGLLESSGNKDINDANILSDMGKRLHDLAYLHQDHARTSAHGNYSGDFRQK